MSHKGFEDTLYEEISGFDINKMLVNIVSFNLYFQEDTIKFILACRSKLVPCYFSKGFVIFKKYSFINV